MVFDKTGTLTAGKPEVTSVVPLQPGAMSAETVLQLAARVESNTTHPVAQVSCRLLKTPPPPCLAPFES